MRKKKYQTKKVNGVRVTVEIEKDHDRELMPRSAVFESKKDYKRSASKARARKEMKDYM